MMTIQDYQQCYSDFYKEAYGFRPRFSTSHWTLEEWQKEWDRLSNIIDINRENASAAEAKAVVDFEELVSKLMKIGAKNRQDSIRWLHDAHSTNGSNSCLCYELGLPYGYLNEK